MLDISPFPDMAILSRHRIFAQCNVKSSQVATGSVAGSIDDMPHFQNWK